MGRLVNKLVVICTMVVLCAVLAGCPPGPTNEEYGDGSDYDGGIWGDEYSDGAPNF